MHFWYLHGSTSYSSWWKMLRLRSEFQSWWNRQKVSLWISIFSNFRDHLYSSHRLASNYWNLYENNFVNGWYSEWICGCRRGTSFRQLTLVWAWDRSRVVQNLNCSTRINHRHLWYRRSRWCLIGNDGLKTNWDVGHKISEFRIPNFKCWNRGSRWHQV